MVGIDRHDVVVLGHRPVRAEHAVLAVVDRVFLAQPLEVGPELVSFEQFGIADVEFVERHRIGALARRVDRFRRAVHDRNSSSKIGLTWLLVDDFHRIAVASDDLTRVKVKLPPLHVGEPLSYSRPCKLF